MHLAGPAIWLRDNCPCPQGRHPGGGQKLVSIGDLPADLRTDDVYHDGGEVHIRFGPVRGPAGGPRVMPPDLRPPGPAGLNGTTAPARRG